MARARPPRQKIGAGHLGAMVRLGFKELGDGLQALPTSNIRPREEQGTAGNPTPGQVDQMQRQAYQQILAQHANRGRGQQQSRGVER